MKSQKPYFYVLLGTTLMLLLGIVYSYSLFRREIEVLFQANAVESALPFMFVLFFYSLFMAIGGILYERYSTTIIAGVGVLLISSGFILASFASSILLITLSYGVMIGSGVGILYGLPLRIVAQMDHPKPGLLTGITLIGFGLSPVIFAPVIEAIMSSVGLSSTFLILGIVYVVLLSIAGYVLVSQDTKEKTANKIDFSVLREPYFYRIYVLFFIGTFIGLSIIGLTAEIGVEQISIDPKQIPIYMALFAVFNGVGRPLFGYLNDSIGFKQSAMLSFVSIAVGSILFWFFSSSIALFVIASIVYYINFGGWLSLAPSATISSFGKENYSQIYGFIFTAYGFGALVGNFITGSIIDSIGIESMYLLMAGLAIIGIIVLQLSTRKTTT